MADLITITGLVATAPRHVVTAEGLAITSFRVASSQRRFDRANQKWIDGDTNWYTVTAFRQLAINAAGSVSKGDRIVVTGRLRVREWDSGEKHGINVDVEADALGHDLTWGTSQFARSISASAGGDSAENATSGATAEPDAPATTTAAALESEPGLEQPHLVASGASAVPF